MLYPHWSLPNQVPAQYRPFSIVRVIMYKLSKHLVKAGWQNKHSINISKCPEMFRYLRNNTSNVLLEKHVRINNTNNMNTSKRWELAKDIYSMVFTN